MPAVQAAKSFGPWRGVHPVPRFLNALRVPIEQDTLHGPITSEQ